MKQSEAFEIRDLPGHARALWNVPGDVRRLITAAAVDAIGADDPAQPGDRWDRIVRITYAVWNAVRDVRCASGLDVGRELNLAGHEPLTGIRDGVVEPLLQAGDLEATLLQKRARIDAQIAALARRRGAAGVRA